MTKSNSTRNRFVSFNTSSLEDVHLSGEDKPLCTDDDTDSVQSGDGKTVAFCGLWSFISRLFGCNDTTRSKYDDDVGAEDAHVDNVDARTITNGIIDR